MLSMLVLYSQQQKYQHDRSAKTKYAPSYCLDVTDIIIVYTYFSYFNVSEVSEGFKKKIDSFVNAHKISPL